MNPSNFLAWMAQIAVLVTMAAAAGLALSRNPRARLIFWQGVLILAVLLPAIQPWSKMAASADGVTISTGAVTVPGGPPAGFHFEWRAEYFLWIAAAGALARLVWIGSGLVNLRRHRLAARRLENPPVPFERAHVNWYVSESVSGPVTFGWLRANVVLPARFLSMAPAIQEAIACHELIHVERRDWLFVIAEELLRALFWFHPAVWFAIGKIQLAREQVVDLEVIHLTRDRERYLDALVAVAEQKFQPDLAPATLFLTKRHLATRVAAILKEKRMSKARILASFTTVAGAALVAARLAVFLFPLHSPAQTIAGAAVADDPGITVDAGAPLLHRAPVFRPNGVTAAGTVAIEATLNAKGEVSDARAVSGPSDLRRTSLESVLQWHYATDPTPPATVRVTIEFGSAPAGGVSGGVNGGVNGGVGGGVRGGIAGSYASTGPATLKSITIMGAPPELAQKVRDALPVHEGDQVTAESMSDILAAAKQVDEHFTGHLSTGGNHEAMLRLNLATAAAGAGSVGAPQRIRVGGNVQQANIVHKVQPLYPPDAKAARIQGVVRLSVTIGKDGTVENIEVLSGDPILVQSAMDAVSQWTYRPTLLNGNPVEVITTVDVNYTLSQ
ncbi:MAG TPA: M56 family metallopeptidase [Bryobacteraceae bacterium]|nr:M56 family metallopeptidase [Bryobacteraceae bacterium]